MSLGMLNISTLSEHSAFIDPAIRLATFNSWIFDSQPGARCTSQKLAEAGFVSATSRNDPYSASCAFCLKILEWEPEDDPVEEHKSHCPNCLFVQTVLEKPIEEITAEEAVRLTSFRFAKINCEEFRTLYKRGESFEEDVKEQMNKVMKSLK